MLCTTSWICDQCGRIIPHADAGWLEYICYPDPLDGRKRCKGLRIVHSWEYRQRPQGCFYDPAQQRALGGVFGDGPLTDFLGPDGMTQLLEFIAEDCFPDVAEVLEGIQRIHTPGYEHARLHFRSALDDGVIEPTVLYGYFWQQDIERVLEFAAQNELSFAGCGG